MKNENWQQRYLSNSASRQQDHRSVFQRDRARILHSAAFRRLQAKTQVMGVGQSDFYRTRLTHSLEAAQIGSGITAQLRSKFASQCQFLLPAEDSLIEAICLAHDIGHPPFGHGGEIALHYMMHNFGGFEGNGQTFRIVTNLEPYTLCNGMNLTRRTLLGLLKYPQLIDRLDNHTITTNPLNFRQLKASDWHPPKGLYADDIELLNWVLDPLSDDDKTQFQKITVNSGAHHKTKYKSFDCSIMELADDIAYGIHDMEDAIVTGIVDKDSFIEHVVVPLQDLNDVWLSNNAEPLADKLFSQQHHNQKDAIGSLVNYLITAIELVDLNSKGCHFNEPLIRYNAALPDSEAMALKIFKDYVYRFVIKQTTIQRMEYKGQQIVMELFEAFASDPQRLLPKATCQRWLTASENSQNPHRVIADYLSGMTDEFATKVYNSMFLANGHSVSEDHY